MCLQTLSFHSTAQLHVDLSPLDCYVLGHIKTLLYQHKLDASQAIHNLPKAFERVQDSIIRHVHACTDSVGGHFEVLLCEL